MNATCTPVVCPACRRKHRLPIGPDQLCPDCYDAAWDADIDRIADRFAAQLDDGKDNPKP